MSPIFDEEPFKREVFLCLEGGRTTGNPFIGLQLSIFGAAKRCETVLRILVRRLDALTVYIWADDVAKVSVNGVRVVTATLPTIASGNCFVRKGDVLTVELTNKRGGEDILLQAHHQLRW